MEASPSHWEFGFGTNKEMREPKSILFLGETYRADAKSWIKGIERESGLKIETMEVESSSSRSARIFKFVIFGLKILKSNFSKSYDLVLAERATSYGFFSLFVNAKKRIVAQQGITDAWPSEGISGKLKRFLQKRVYQKVDLIHAWGEVMVPAMIESNADPSRILILPKGVDLSLYKFSLPNQKEPNRAIVTRSLGEVYHHSDILNALAILKNSGVKLSLTIVGDGPLMDSLKEKVEQLGISNLVGFTGRIPNEQLPEMLRKSSIYISVPETEGVSASLFEAMASGCFPIVTDLPGTRAFINQGENGFLVPVNSPNKIAECLLTYLNNPEKSKIAVLKNRQFIEKHVDLRKNMAIIWKRYLDLFQN